MNFEEKKTVIERITQELLEKMGFEGAVIQVSTKISPQEEGSPVQVEIKTKDASSSYLIGKHGVNLAALQHILRVLVKKATPESEIGFNVDVNDYRKEQQQGITDLARETAEKVLVDQQSMALRPMNSFERRLVHTELADFEGVETESSGEGEERKVIIRPTL
jgi:spoIIIJ-associated protein